MEGPQDIPVFGETTQPQSVHDACDPAPQVSVCAWCSIIGYCKLELALCSEGHAFTCFLDINLVLCAGLNFAPIKLFKIPFVSVLLSSLPQKTSDENSSSIQASLVFQLLRPFEPVGDLEIKAILVIWVQRHLLENFLPVFSYLWWRRCRVWEHGDVGHLRPSLHRCRWA